MKKVVLSVLILLNFFTNGFVIKADQVEEYNRFINDDYNTNGIIIMMNEEVSREKETFDTSYFPEIKCEKITIINDYEHEEYFNQNSFDLESKDFINFKTMLFIELKEKK